MRFVSILYMTFMFLFLLTNNIYAAVPDYNDALLCINQTEKFEKEYDIKKYLLTAISNVETGHWNDTYKTKVAWPWTVNAEGKGYYYSSKKEAIAKVKKLQKQGIKSIDVGCMQINLKYHPKAFSSLDEAFNPKKNVEYAANFLTKLYDEHNDWLKAASSYHSRNKTKGGIYKTKVIDVFDNIYKTAKNGVQSYKTAFLKQAIQKKVDNITSSHSKDINDWRSKKVAEYRMKKSKKTVLKNS